VPGDGVGEGVATGRNPATVRTSVPTAAAENTKSSTDRALRVVVGAYIIIICIVPVIAPFVDITCHIIKAVTIGRETTAGSRIWFNTVIPVRMIAHGRAYIVWETAGISDVIRLAVGNVGVGPWKPFAGKTAADGVFPFGLGW